MSTTNETETPAPAPTTNPQAPADPKLPKGLIDFPPPTSGDSGDSGSTAGK